MTTLALNMIARDEAPRIADALRSAAPLCDEMIVVVDTRSTDDTADVARACGATVIMHEWSSTAPSYADARNCALDATTADWVLVLDADDVIDNDNAARIAALKATLGDDCDGIFATYDYERGAAGHQRFPIQRFVRRDPSLRWTGCVHEIIAFPDPARVLMRDDITITHRYASKDRTDRSQQLAILDAAIANGTATEREYFYRANELRNAGHHAEALEAYIAYARRDDAIGWQRYYALACAGGLAWEARDMTNARRYCAQAILVDPSRAEAYVQLGEIEMANDNHAGAMPLFHAALAATPPVGGFVTHEAYREIPTAHIATIETAMNDADRVTHDE